MYKGAELLLARVRLLPYESSFENNEKCLSDVVDYII